MALIVADRVQETTTTTGTGTVTLAGAVSGFRAFSAVCANTDTIYYAIVGTTEWEVGLGTWGTGGTLARSVLTSSNANALVNFSAGTKNVFATYPGDANAMKAMLGIVSGGDTIIFQTNTTDFKDSVLVATTANITLSGEQTIDGVLTSASRVLVKDQTTGSQNGIYVSAAGAWARADDADADTEVTSGLLVLCEDGTVNANTLFSLVTADPITVGTTALTFDSIVLPSNPEVLKSVTAATYTLIISDPNKWLKMNRATGQTITVPANSTAKIPVNSVIWGQVYGAGATTFAAAGSVNIRSTQGLTISTQYAIWRLKKIGTNEWSLTFFGDLPKATAAEVRSAASNKVVTADLIESASADVALTDAATIALDWDTGINFAVTLGGSRTLGNPTNGQPGTWRTITVTQDGTGSRTLAYGGQYQFAGGTEPVLTTTAAAIDFLTIYCKSASVFYVFSALDMKV